MHWPGIWCPCWYESCEAVQAPAQPCSNPNLRWHGGKRCSAEALGGVLALDCWPWRGPAATRMGTFTCASIITTPSAATPWTGWSRIVCLGSCSTSARQRVPEARTQRWWHCEPSVTVRASHGTAAQAMVAATQEQAAATSDPLVPMTKEKKPAATARMLRSEVVEGILLDKKAARAHMREHLRARTIIAEEADVKPLAHDRYFLFQGKCLRCEDAAQAVVYKGTVEVPLKAFTLTSVYEHNHADDAPADTARTF